MKDDSSAKWVQDIIIDEIVKIIVELDTKANRTRDASSLEACKQFARLAFGDPDERRAREQRSRGEAHTRELARDFFKKHIAVHFPN